MTFKNHTVLFLCTGNSARSILAEATLNHLGNGKFKAYSAGSQPTGKVNPFAIELLASMGIATNSFRSKSWNEFSDNTYQIDFVITVCGNAADEVCPIWPGHPLTAHWGVPDPAAATGSDEQKRQAFLDAYNTLKHRIELLIALPINKLDHSSLQLQLEAIGYQ
jgi:arsenate reductase (thioredoxin)